MKQKREKIKFQQFNQYSNLLTQDFFWFDRVFKLRSVAYFFHELKKKLC